MNDFPIPQPACTHPSPSLPDQHLVSWVTEGGERTVADTAVAVAGWRGPTPKLWNPSQYIGRHNDRRHKEGELTKLLAVGKDLGHVAGEGASAHALGLVAEDGPGDWGDAGELGGGVAVAVLHPCRDGSVAGDAGAVDEHVLDLAADCDGALLELGGAAVGVDCKEKKMLVLVMMMLDRSL
jgi:hypothetical protein